MDKKGLVLNSRFALPPNSLGFCGKDSAPEKFKNCVIKGKCQGVAGEISKFIVLNPYLKTISKISGQCKYSHKVSQCYWIGNNILKKSKASDFAVLMNNFIKQGVPKDYVYELRKNDPKIFLPTHLFQVLFIGAYGNRLLKPNEKIKWINNCMIRWGKVTKVNKTFLQINLNSLTYEKGKYRFLKKVENVSYITEFLPNIKKGMMAAVHWNQALFILSEKESSDIKYWSEKVVDIVNSAY